jgi:hypothetical protein
VELAALLVAHLAERRVGDDFPDPAAQLGARHMKSSSGPAAGSVHAPPSTVRSRLRGAVAVPGQVAVLSAPATAVALIAATRHEGLPGGFGCPHFEQIFSAMGGGVLQWTVRVRRTGVRTPRQMADEEMPVRCESSPRA